MGMTVTAVVSHQWLSVNFHFVDILR
jgi:hypothetical protein